MRDAIAVGSLTDKQTGGLTCLRGSRSEAERVGMGMIVQGHQTGMGMMHSKVTRNSRNRRFVVSGEVGKLGSYPCRCAIFLITHTFLFL